MRVVLVLVLVASCVKSSAEHCSDGRVCPSGTECYAPLSLCIVPGQLTACGDAADGTDCSFGDRAGSCVDGVCVEQQCGDRIISGAEKCDRDILPPDRDGTGVATCATIGYYEPRPLVCKDDCTFDVTDCGPHCGDGVLQTGEDCDGTLMREHDTCDDLAYYNAASLGCTSFCTYDVALCDGRCGDDILQADHEVCDQTVPPGTCLDYGYDAGPLVCAAGCYESVDDCTMIRWRYESTVTPRNLYGVHGSSATSVFAVGDAGEIHYNDGSSWQRMTSPAMKEWVDVWSDAPNNAWAIASDGTIARWNGSAWLLDMTVTVGSELRGIWGTSSNDLWVVGAGGKILHRTAAGWQAPVASIPNIYFYDVWGSGAGDVWVVGDAGTIYHFDGLAWSESASVPGTFLRGVGGSGPRDVWAVGGEATNVTVPVIRHYNGSSWKTVTPSAADSRRFANGSIGRIAVAGPNDAFAIGDGVGARLYHWNGHTWSVHTSPTTQGHYAVWAASPSSAMVVGEFGMVLRYDGRAWTSGKTGAGVSANWAYSIWGSDPDDVWAVGLSGMILHGDALGWAAPLPDPNGFSYSAVWGSAPNDVWMIDDRNGARRWDGVTLSAKVALPGPQQRIEGIWGTGPHDIWAVGASGKLLHYSGTTPSWESVAPVTTENLDGVWGSARDDVYAVGSNGKLIHYNGTQWSSITLPTTKFLEAIWGSGPRDIWIVGELGTMLHYDGTAWTSQVSPTPGTLYDVFGFGPDDVFVTGPSGFMAHYNGTSWTQVRAPTPTLYARPWGTPRQITFVGPEGDFYSLDRSAPWSCAAKERYCGDMTDDDCDGVIDAADADCKSIALAEIHSGTVDYVEITNRGTATANLYGLTVSMKGSCDAATRSLRLRVDAIVAPQGVLRLEDDIDDVRPNERYTGTDTCDEPRGNAWYALCSGPCDLTSCSNLLDYVERSTTGAAVPGKPACATFSAINVGNEPSTASTTNSLQRVNFTGTTGDWVLGASSRN